ncbi:Nucleotide-binding protein RHOA_v2_2294 [Rhodovastum atsumiense]|uniref:RNase adapter RapZ n=1 Tax=Rhodovastum atsumiense TaxID=504468 RepID=A0A5M6IQ12_9PROT|nr:RNase adapter RapZ [Rhodovastum atsumiense]KAA5610351.1 RNase adapter RapZ [Rhodovastum atsumiense]CAH2600906.1 Nucleotide-binding protein RHOA_v2_2294 [Rhodovastum atsumiense]
MSEGAPIRQPVVLVTGLSGAGKASILRALEDLGYEAIDNPPLELIEGMVAPPASGTGRRIAIGVDARSRGFDAQGVLDTLARLRLNPAIWPELIFAWADEAILQRRYTETRRRHPLSPRGRVAEGIAAEQALTAKLREVADLVIDTSELPLAELRRLIDQRYGAEGQREPLAGLSVTLVSFAFPAGLPREADMVFDTRFLRNPHYVQALKPHTGLEPAVGAYIESDPDYRAFFIALTGLLGLVLPRFVQEGKKYATIAVGCTGGRHRSVHIVERLAFHLTQAGWRVTTTHRELIREEARARAPALASDVGFPDASRPPGPSVQAQEA